VLKQLRNAPASVDAHGPLPSTPVEGQPVVIYPSELAGRSKEVDDVLGLVAEVIAEVLVWLRPMDVGAIDEAATIRPDQAADERLRRSVNDRLLPDL
jgi:hypothetical protein